MTRVGKKKQPMYRLAVMEKARDPWGHALELLGSVNPHTTPRTVQLKADRIQHWISKGAEATDTVWNLLVDEGIVEGEKRATVHLSKKRRGKLEEAEKEKQAKEEEVKAKAEEAAAAEAAPEPEAPKEAAAEEPKAEEVKKDVQEETKEEEEKSAE